MPLQPPHYYSHLLRSLLIIMACIYLHHILNSHLSIAATNLWPVGDHNLGRFHCSTASLQSPLLVHGPCGMVHVLGVRIIFIFVFSVTDCALNMVVVWLPME